MTVITNIEDLRILAQKRVPRMFYDYVFVRIYQNVFIVWGY